MADDSYGWHTVEQTISRPKSSRTASRLSRSDTIAASSRRTPGSFASSRTASVESFYDAHDIIDSIAKEKGGYSSWAWENELKASKRRPVYAEPELYTDSSKRRSRKWCWICGLLVLLLLLAVAAVVPAVVITRNKQARSERASTDNAALVPVLETQAPSVVAPTPTTTAVPSSVGPVSPIAPVSPAVVTDLTTVTSLRTVTAAGLQTVTQASTSTVQVVSTLTRTSTTTQDITVTLLRVANTVFSTTSVNAAGASVPTVVTTPFTQAFTATLASPSAPVLTTIPTLASTPTAAAATSASIAGSSSTTSSPTSQTYTGDATFFFQNNNAGNCGIVHLDSDYVIALDTRMYANGANCGRTVMIRRQSTGVTVQATVQDSCPTCNSATSIDLSVATFRSIATDDEGLVQVDWWFTS